MKAYVDKDTCIGCGLCTSICSEVFEMDSDGKAVAIQEELVDLQVNDSMDAESECPVAAIKVK